ncbi:methyltransferase domain-containing protein [Caballeronia sp. M23-90]
MFPAYLKPVSMFFRRRRNRRLVAIIEKLWMENRRLVNVLDIGGSLIFWLSIPESARGKCNISLLNLPEAYKGLPQNEDSLSGTVTLLIGDARDLSRFSDQSFDLVICNSVIEHVGSWTDMRAAASEARRVGRRGWVQVPAFEFPVEQHFLFPLIHWMADAFQIWLLRHFHREFRGPLSDEMYMAVYYTRPLTRAQLRHLFPGTEIRSEWLLFPKSHIATW